MIAWRIAQEQGLDLCAVVARDMWSWKRLRSELRRDGPRLLDKIYRKLILSEKQTAARTEETLADLADQSGLPYQRLRAFCKDLSVPYLLAPDHNHPSAEDLLRKAQPDVIAFTGGGLIRKNILDLPEMGVLNCHAGLLPRYRGMDVVEWALLEAEDEPPQTGITLHFMDRGVDTGPIVKNRPIAVQPGDDLESLRARFLPAMVELVIEGLVRLQDGRLQPSPQIPEDGRQYFVMHPRLREAASEQIRSMML
jgi:methionyl-tRNA formyltransferase